MVSTDSHLEISCVPETEQHFSVKLSRANDSTKILRERDVRVGVKLQTRVSNYTRRKWIRTDAKLSHFYSLISGAHFVCYTLLISFLVLSKSNACSQNGRTTTVNGLNLDYLGCVRQEMFTNEPPGNYLPSRIRTTDYRLEQFRCS